MYSRCHPLLHSDVSPEAESSTWKDSQSLYYNISVLTKCWSGRVHGLTCSMVISITCVLILTWASLKFVSSFNSPHYLWISHGPFSLPFVQNKPHKTSNIWTSKYQSSGISYWRLWADVDWKQIGHFRQFSDFACLESYTKTDIGERQYVINNLAYIT